MLLDPSRRTDPKHLAKSKAEHSLWLGIFFPGLISWNTNFCKRLLRDKELCVKVQKHHNLTISFAYFVSVENMFFCPFIWTGTNRQNVLEEIVRKTPLSWSHCFYTIFMHPFKSYLLYTCTPYGPYLENPLVNSATKEQRSLGLKLWPKPPLEHLHMNSSLL